MLLGGELLIDDAPLRLADALDNDLLCRLGSDTAKLLGLNGDADHVAQLGPAADLLGGFQVDLHVGVLNLLHHGLFHAHFNALFILIQENLHVVAALRIVPAEGGQHGLVDLVVHVASGNTLFLLDILYSFKKFCVHFINPFYIVTCSFTCAVCAFSNVIVSLPTVTVTFPWS